MLANARARAAARFELPAVARAHQPLARDETVTDPAAVVRALVLHDHDPAALEPRYRDRSRPVARAHDPPDRHVDPPGLVEAQVGELRHPIVGVIAKLVDQLCAKRAHAPKATFRV